MAETQGSHGTSLIPLVHTLHTVVSIYTTGIIFILYNKNTIQSLLCDNFS